MATEIKEPARQKDMSLLKPQTKIKMEAFKRFCNEQWLYVKEFETLRSLERQKYLYSVGRTIRKGERPITWTMNSKHLTGEAVDFVFLTDNNPKLITWSWDRDKFKKFAGFFWLDSLAPTEQCHLQDNGNTVKQTMDSNWSWWNITRSQEERRLLKRANDIFRELLKTW